jgi:hypothetical protein
MEDNDIPPQMIKELGSLLTTVVEEVSMYGECTVYAKYDGEKFTYRVVDVRKKKECH